KSGYSWSLDGGTALPAGLTFNAATGAITGTPTTAGKTSVKLAVTDTLGLKTTLDMSFNVVQRLLLVKTPLRAAKTGVAYNAVVQKTGGARPFKWTMTGAPRGVKLSTTGRLTGIATKAGAYRLKLRVTDALGATSSRTY